MTPRGKKGFRAMKTMPRHLAPGAELRSGSRESRHAVRDYEADELPREGLTPWAEVAAKLGYHREQSASMYGQRAAKKFCNRLRALLAGDPEWMRRGITKR